MKRLRSKDISEKEEFARNIKQWFPIAIIIGILVGIAMSLFSVFTFLISTLLGSIFPLLGMLIGGLVILLLVKIGFEDPELNGISYVLRKKHEGKTVPLSQTQEFVSAGISVGSGLPVGREGPALIIGSAIASKISEWRNIEPYQLHEAITIGSAAATGALFQAPFGSAVFAAEVPYKEDSDETFLMVSFLASVVAAVTLRSIIDLISNNIVEIDLHLFRIGEAILDVSIVNSLYAFVIGLSIGLLGRGVIDIYYRYKTAMKKYFQIERGFLIGLIISLSSLFIGFLIIEDFYLAEGISSFDAISGFIGVGESNIVIVLIVALMIQIISTIAIIAVGFPGGIFTPTLSMGAISGILFAYTLGLNSIPVITAWAIVGMSASHAAFTKTPVASILLVLEITNMPNLIIPLIFANIAAYIVSGHRSLYEGQVRSRDATLLKELSKYDQFSEITIKQVMTPQDQVIFAIPEMELERIKEISQETGKRTFPVLENDKLVGIISLNDIVNGINLGKHIVNEVMTKDVVTVRKDMVAREALYKMLSEDVERTPVINDDNELEGIVTLQDVLRGHQKLISSNLEFN